MFVPEFNYTRSIVKNLMDIEGAKEVIENSAILPIWQSRRQKDALIRQAHHTTRIEGAQLTIEQVRDLVDDKPVVARERDIIHPFLDGNGRTARALANLILYHGGCDIKRLFSLEEYYDANPAGYYEALQSVRITGELTTWLEYFTAGIAEEMQKIKILVLSHSRDRALRDKIGQIELSERQLEILSYVEENRQITNRELQELAQLSNVSAHKELMTLVGSGVLKKEGKGRATHYVLIDDF